LEHSANSEEEFDDDFIPQLGSWMADIEDDFIPHMRSRAVYMDNDLIQMQTFHGPPQLSNLILRLRSVSERFQFLLSEAESRMDRFVEIANSDSDAEIQIWTQCEANIRTAFQKPFNIRSLLGNSKLFEKNQSQIPLVGEKWWFWNCSELYEERKGRKDRKGRKGRKVKMEEFESPEILIDPG
jgi:hypothetical protein